MRMAAFPLGPWDYFRRDVQRIRNHFTGLLGIPPTLLPVRGRFPQELCISPAKEKKSTSHHFLLQLQCPTSNILKVSPKIHKKLHWEIKHWQIYTVDLLQITILDVCVLLPSLYTPFQRSFPAHPSGHQEAAPDTPQIKMERNSSNMLSLNIKMSTSPSTSCFMLSLNIRKC